MQTMTKMVSPENLKTGDTVEIDGAMYTIGRNDIKHDKFYGHTLVRGLRFTQGIKQVLFPVWSEGKIIGYN